MAELLTIKRSDLTRITRESAPDWARERHMRALTNACARAKRVAVGSDCIKGCGCIAVKARIDFLKFGQWDKAMLDHLGLSVKDDPRLTAPPYGVVVEVVDA